jgi:RimJ/RimL family protein N-acetyltransferase
MEGPQLRLSVVTEAEALSLHRLHQSALTSGYLYGRDVSFFEERARTGELYALSGRGTGMPIGMCYIYVDSADAPHEFGGLFVESAFRGKKLGKQLGAIAIARHMANAGGRLIANVHMHNPDPGPLLEKLGFRKTGVAELPPERVPAGMLCDDDGYVRGHKYTYDSASLGAIVDVLDDWNTEVQVDIENYENDKNALITALLSIAAGPVGPPKTP